MTWASNLKRSGRKYSLMKIKCGLTALLIHDPEIYLEGPPEHKKAEEEEDEEPESGDGELRRERKGKGGASQTKMVAAAMRVGIGSFSDPIEAQGLAHFLEFLDENEGGRIIFMTINLKQIHRDLEPSYILKVVNTVEDLCSDRSSGMEIASGPTYLERRMSLFRVESAKAILNNDSGKFSKRYIRSIGELVGNQSLLCASHQHHKLIRSQLTNLFSASSLSVFIKQFDQLIVDALRGWEQRSTMVIQDEAH